jgi:hypothetical protein
MGSSMAPVRAGAIDDGPGASSPAGEGEGDGAVLGLVANADALRRFAARSKSTSGTVPSPCNSSASSAAEGAPTTRAAAKTTGLGCGADAGGTDGSPNAVASAALKDGRVGSASSTGVTAGVSSSSPTSGRSVAVTTSCGSSADCDGSETRAVGASGARPGSGASTVVEEDVAGRLIGKGSRGLDGAPPVSRSIAAKVFTDGLSARGPSAVGDGVSTAANVVDAARRGPSARAPSALPGGPAAGAVIAALMLVAEGALAPGNAREASLGAGDAPAGDAPAGEAPAGEASAGLLASVTARCAAAPSCGKGIPISVCGARD